MGDEPTRLVIDANIFVSAFLKLATTRRLILDERLELYAPADLIRETQKVLKERLAKRLQTLSDFEELFSALVAHIHILEKDLYESRFQEAITIAPHDEDAPYLACALHLKIALWSNDAGMKEQDCVTVLTTTELLKELEL